MKNPLRGLLVTQFFGAFNDNAWKLIVALLAIERIRGEVGDVGPEFEAAAQTQTMLPFMVISLALMLFSLPAGVVADRLSKRTVIIAAKGVEILLMAVGTLLLWSNPSGSMLLLVVLGIMGAQSAFFSPAKYGILPEILDHERLSAGNGALELWTFMAIIAGTAMAGPLLDKFASEVWVVGAILTTLAIIGFLAAFSVPRVSPARSEGGIFDTVSIAWAAMRGDRVLWLSVMGLMMFWFVVALLGQNIVVYAKAVLHLSDAKAGYPMVAFAIGIAAGSVLAGKFSAAKVEYGLPPLGAISLFFTTLVFGLWGPQLVGTMILMALAGTCSGLIIVPLHALLQWRSATDRRGAVIALSNVFAFGSMLLGSLAATGFSLLDISSKGIFLAASFFLLGCTIWAIRLLPDALLRLVLVLLTHTVYRLKVIGRSNVPEAGGALLVPNHVSFADGLYVLASLDRHVSFLVESSYFHRPLFKPFMKSLRAIPLASSGGPRELLSALREAGKRLEEGELVCIFGEGQITRTGMLGPFQRGLERIVKGRTAPIIPVNLDRVWGSIFSWAGGRFVTKVPEQIPYPVTVSFGTPLPPGVSFSEVRTSVQSLSESAWRLRKADRPPLHHTFIRVARRRPFRFAMADLSFARISRIGALSGSIALARALRRHWEGQKAVGILLPSSVAGFWANVAAALSGKTSVNLNFTAGSFGLTSAARQANLTTVLSSRAFLEKAKIELPEGVTPIWIEDLRDTIGAGTKFLALCLGLFAPIRVIERACGASKAPSPDDIITVIFSSGSTGEPKGVRLSHFNIDSNEEAAAQVFRLEPSDCILGILPFFHSFGYMATIWLAVNQGMGVVYHPNPLDGGAIGPLVQRYRITFLLATPTFLQVYLRRCSPAQFGSLRVVLTGAEKLSERLLKATLGFVPLKAMERLNVRR